MDELRDIEEKVDSYVQLLEQEEVMEIFQSYDVDGSNTIDKAELKSILVDLCIPVDDDNLSQIYQTVMRAAPTTHPYTQKKERQN